MKERLLKRQNRRETFYDFLAEANELYDDGSYEEVRELLVNKFAQNPSAESDDSLELLGNAAVKLKDYATIAKVFRKLTARVPDEIHFQVNYSAALLSLELPLMAKGAFERLKNRWPDDPLTKSADETLRSIERGIELTYEKFPWSSADRPALALLHEEMMFGITTNDYGHVVQHGVKLLARAPDFLPVYNNLAIAYRELGKTADAVRTCEELLARDPENPHAIVIFGDTLYAQGRRTEARQVWARIQAIPSDKFTRADWMTRKAEALVRLGEYDQALTAIQAGDDQGLFHPNDPQTAVDFHLAAVAAARLGQHRTASQYWTRALRVHPNYDLATENRADHERPVGERSGAWFDGRMSWIPKDFRDSIRTLNVDNLAHNANEMIRKLAARMPELPDLITDTLTTGSPLSRKLAIALCKAEIPALRERLRDFALSPHGTDQERSSAVLWLQQQGIIREKVVPLWVKGEQSEFKLLSAKINFEGKNEFPAAVDKLQSAGYRAIQNGKFAEAERQYRQAIELHGDNPSLLFNLAKALDFQDKTVEADQIKDDVIARWPDYFFGKVELALQAIEQRDYERGREILKPLGDLEEYHISEYLFLCFTWADLELEAGRPEAAKAWVEQARKLDPQNANLPMFDVRLKLLGGRSFFGNSWK